jgi:hypothetical protein
MVTTYQRSGARFSVVIPEQGNEGLHRHTMHCAICVRSRKSRASGDACKLLWAGIREQFRGAGLHYLDRGSILFFAQHDDQNRFSINETILSFFQADTRPRMQLFTSNNPATTLTCILTGTLLTPP